ncbi:Histidinol-phosphatase alternative form [Aurantiacibacter gangjinensis]|nr:Histidinol-phosphatase alternative form [Aurantiacibacter gangjinensis]
MRLEQICREAGYMALSRWPGHGHALESWEKEPGSPVCEADLEVDAFLRRELGSLLPSAGWLSEETRDNDKRLAKGLIWLVDPIDGTRDFIRGRSGWAVSVALVSGGRPLIGVLVAPARNGGEVWSATAGKGAWRNGKRLAASTRRNFVGARVPAHDLSKEDRDLTKVEQPNSIALRVAMVADDQADLVATLRWGYEWDIAAAALIAREAGASVTDAFGKPLAYNKRDPRAFGLLVSAPGIHAAAVERLAERAARLS